MEKSMIKDLIEDMTKLIIKTPENAILYEERGDLYYQLEKYDKAIEDYNKAIKFGDKLELVQSSGEFYSTTGRYDDIESASEWELMNEAPYIKIGDIYFKLKEYDDALSYYDKVVSLYDFLFDPECYSDENTPDINVFSCMDKFHMKDEYYERRGDTYFKLEEYWEAKCDYDKAIEINSNKDQYYYKRGIVNYRLEKYKEAADDYERIILTLENMK